jgi:hypothetical protein
MVTKRPHSKLEGTTGVGAGSPWAQSSKDFVNSHNTRKDNAIHPNMAVGIDAHFIYAVTIKPLTLQ